jgi:hypothetical protein
MKLCPERSYRGSPSSLARRAPSSARERMPSLPEIFEVVIGVDIHVQT